VADIFLVGSGVRQADHLTIEAVNALGFCTEIYSLIPQAFIPDRYAEKVHSLRELNRPGITWDDICRQAVDLIWRASLRNPPVAYLAVGNSVVFDSVTAGVLARSRHTDRHVEVIAGISSVDAVMAALEIDYWPGIQVYNANSLMVHHIAPRNDVACLLLQPDFVGTPVRVELQSRAAALRPLRDHLLCSYPAEHTVSFVTCGGASRADTRIDSFPLGQLADAEVCPELPGASLFIPPAAQLG